MGHRRSRKPTGPAKEAEETLDRFAGSSEEEDDPEASDEEDPEEEEKEGGLEKSSGDEQKDAASESTNQQKRGENDSETDEGDLSDDEPVAASGMASAMSKILGMTAKPGTGSVVLSKTTTKLQRLAKQEKQLQKEQRAKRKANRERNLISFHIPLSVATTRQSAAGSSAGLVKEMEMERSYRRVATRGVVALFNAITQHQQKANVDSATSSQKKSKTDVKHMTKRSFLDMIKTTAAEKSAKEKASDTHGAGSTGEEQPASTKTTSSKTSWNALKDDYMMSPKLKDWDKEESSDEASAADDDHFSGEEGETEPKKRRVGAQ